MESLSFTQYYYLKNYVLPLSDIGSEYNYEQNEEEVKVVNIHDKIFKEVLGLKEEAVKFINKNLGLENTKYALKEEEIEKYNRDFISGMFNYMVSDVIYKKRDQNIFFLIEHQSTIDYSMPYRILKYNLAIMESAIDAKELKKKSYKLPTVYSFVIYTGEQKWNVSQYIVEKQERLKGCKKSTIGNFYITDVNDYTKEELLDNKDLLSDMMILEKVKNIKELEEYLDIISKRHNNDEKNRFIKRLIEYIFKYKISYEKYVQIKERLEVNKGDEFMFVQVLTDWIDENFGALEEEEKKVAKKQRSVEEKEKNIEEQQRSIDKKEKNIEEQQRSIDKKEKNIEEQQRNIDKKEQELEKKAKILNNREDRIIIEMLKNNFDDQTIIKIAEIKPEDLTRIKKQNNLSKVDS